MIKIKKICVITGTRAEYGLLKPLIDEIKKCAEFELQLIVTGMHLSQEFGETYRAIEADGQKINKKIEMLLSTDTPAAITKSMGLAQIGFADALKELMPDLIVVLGDRYEILSAVSSALIFGIPVAHLHGGEITEGAFDDAIRHAISKMSHLHFTSTKSHKDRVIQMGENPDKVFNVGAIGLDNIKNMKLLSQIDLEETLGVKLKERNLLIAYHPVTMEGDSSKEYFANLLKALDDIEGNVMLFFTYANSDTYGRVINNMIDEYVAINAEKAVAYKSLGSLKFLSLMSYVDAIVGNSSSGIIEAPSLHVPTVNIGNRQKGRTCAESVIHCGYAVDEVSKSINTACSASFQKHTQNCKNPYGGGNTANEIISIFKDCNFDELNFKSFYNIDLG